MSNSGVATTGTSRIRVWIAAALVGCAAVALIGLWSIDLDGHRALVEQQLEAAVGRDVRLGAIALQFRPELGLRIDDVAVAGLEDEGGGDVLSLGSLRLGADLGALLGRRLQITSVVLERPRANLVKLADGTWNLARLLPDSRDEGSASGPPADLPVRVTVDEVRLEDAAIDLRDGERHWTLDGIDLSLRSRELDRPIELVVSADIGGEASAGLRFEGTVGPLRGDEPLAVVGVLRLDRVDPDRLLELIGRESAIGHGGEQRSPISLGLTIDGARRPADGAIEVRRFELDFDGRRAAIDGEVTPDAIGAVVDLTLAPTSLQAADLQSLLAVFGSDMELGSPQPIAIAGAVRGPLGGGRKPNVTGQIGVRQLRLGGPSMTVPIDRLDADVKLDGQRCSIRELRIGAGANDFTGWVDVDGFGPFRVRFELESEHVDFAQLVARMAPSPDGAESSGSTAGVQAEGRIRVTKGTFDQVRFEGLQATMRLRDEVFALDPVEMRLYDGRFNGKVTRDLRHEDGRFELQGLVQTVDLGALLSDGLGRSELIAGRLSGRIDALGTGEDYAAVVRSLRASGSLEVTDGRTWLFNVANRLSRVTGVFGEQSAAGADELLNTAGTVFRRLEGSIEIADGSATVDALVLEADAFDLSGRASVDLIGQTIDGRFHAVFSRNLSALMRRDGSKAAELFWNRDLERVELPFALRGALSAPEASVDFTAAARSLALREADRRLGGLAGSGLQEAAGRLLGGDGQPDPERGNRLGGLARGLLGKGGDESTEAATVARGDGLEIVIQSAKWTGLLSKNVEVRGTVTGDQLATVGMIVTDARDRQVVVERDLDGLSKKMKGTIQPIEFKARVDGKRLKLFTAPYTIAVTAQSRAGKVLTARRAVN